MKKLELINFIENHYPLNSAALWDYVGLQLDNEQENVSGVVVCLDVMLATLQYAKDKQCNFIISHHPFRFEPEEQFWENKNKLALINYAKTNQIAIYSLHTNFDMAMMGMNARIAKGLGLEFKTFIGPEHDLLLATFPQGISEAELMDRIKHYFSINFVKVINPQYKTINDLHICAGSGGQGLVSLPDNSLYLTGEIKWSDIIYALNHNITIYLAGHIMEQKFIDYLHEQFHESLEDLKVEGFKITNPINIF